jgi:hypothetical protein
VPRYRLLTETGEDLGPLHLSRGTWVPGERIDRGPTDSLTVVRVVPSEADDDVDGYLVVTLTTHDEPVALENRQG